MHCRSLIAPSLFAVALLGPPSVAQVKLKHALPEHAILYLGAPDIRASLGEMRDMPIAQMWREPEVQDFFADALKMAEAHIQKALEQGAKAHEQGMLPFHPDELMRLRVQGAAFALTSMDLRPGEGEPQPHFGMVAQVDFGESAASWRKIIEFGLNALEMRAQGKLQKEVSEVGGATVITLVPPETDMSLNFAFVGNGLVFGTIRSEVETVLGNLASGKAALSGSDNFKKTFAQLDTQSTVMECFFQPQPLLDFCMRVLDMASKEAPEFPVWLDVAGIGRAVDALGLRGVNAIGFTSSYRRNGDMGNKSVTKSFCYAPAPTRKGLLGGANKQLDMKFLRWVPKDAASFSAMAFDLGAIHDGLVGAIKAYDEETAARILAMLDGYEKQFGLSVKEDLIGSLGSEFISWSMPVAAIGTTPEMAILIEVKDQERLLKTLRTISELSQGAFEIDSSERRGITVYQLQINYDPSGGMGFNPLDMFIPTFSFKDGYIVAGFSTGDVKRVFKRMEREDDPTGDIRGNAEFKPYLESLPKSGLNSVSFSDWKANFEGMYQLVTSLAAFIPVNDEIPIDLSLLPDVTTLTQHLFGAVSWSRADGTGFHSVSQGPWGPETIGLLSGAIGAGAAIAVGHEKGLIR